MKTETESNSASPIIPFRFKELKVYASTEWLEGNNKKYRQVFDRYDTTYIYAELSVYNKMFDQEAWTLELTLKCFSVQENNKELCSIDVKKNVSKYQNVQYVREGWGNKEFGNFWKKGTYYWEAWHGDKKIATKFFYIEEHLDDDGLEDNPYVKIKSAKLYQSGQSDIAEDDRIYLTAFNAEETAYIYSELVLQNTNLGAPWTCEVIFRYYTETKELKGQVSRLIKVSKGDPEVVMTAGWGTSAQGSWREGRYSLELIMFDQIIATVPFEVGLEAVQGIAKVWLPGQESPTLLEDQEPLESLEELMADLHRLIGLELLKKQIVDHATYIQFIQLRKSKGFEEKESMSLHAIYTGNPGTGKTTVAQKMGKIYRQMGLLSKGHVHQVDRVDLVGEFIGQTAPKVKEAIKKARGGVLFIDEAYALARMNDDSKDFGREALEILIKEMGSAHNDLVVIAAGYPKEMEHLVKSNPGLKSRFKNFYHFPDYMPQELMEIAEFAAEKKEVLFTEPAKQQLHQLITEAFRNRSLSFGNARFVHDLVEKAKIKMGLRLMGGSDLEDASKMELETINLEDVHQIKTVAEKYRPVILQDKELLEEGLKELEGLVGLESVKTSIKEMVDIVKYYRETGQDVLNSFFLHTVFIGRPGTGKTTVARILAKLYKALGILERGHIVETDRQGLVGQYIGQTAVKTTEQIDKAQGGVLFIDEAYALQTASHQDYGHEAIQTLLKRMEDDRGQFFVFVAGYPDNMERFLKSNPGLNSRFDRTLHFDDYSPKELLSIAVSMLVKVELEINGDAEQELESIIQRLHLQRDKSFGNARAVRKLIDQIIKNQNLRCARAESNIEQSRKVLREDIRFEDETSLFTKVKIGFKK